MSEQKKVRLNKYQRTRVLSARALQLAQGAGSTVDVTGLHDHIEIAKKELREGKLPMVVNVSNPDGTIDIIKDYY